ncbi:hypothetical protein CNR22_15160 [Sphingobacteriaceae bacterium]|nr:hypothetical protein CNR22_15160 [Sphingobacteriaceae bacterium]
MFPVKQATTQKELEAILALRYKILRQPWNQSFESATDGSEAGNVNAFIEDLNGTVIACGRLQENENKIGQVRFMAVDDAYQGKGLGKLILKFLEEKGRVMQLQKIELHARENALAFYESAGYKHKEISYKLWGIIQHYLMVKVLDYARTNNPELEK